MTAHITTNAMRRVWLAVVLTAVSIPSYSQFLPDLQAKTPEEYDAYLDAIDGPVIEKGPAFERDFPASALRLPVCELMAREWRSRGDAVQAAAAAERGLAIAPDYVPLLVEIADLLANGSGGLERADIIPPLKETRHSAADRSQHLSCLAIFGQSSCLNGTVELSLESGWSEVVQ